MQRRKIAKSRFWVIRYLILAGDPRPTSLSVSLLSLFWGCYLIVSMYVGPYTLHPLAQLGDTPVLVIGMAEILVGVARLVSVVKTDIHFRRITLAIQGIEKLFVTSLFFITSPYAPLAWIYIIDTSRVIWVYLRLGSKG